MMLWMTCCKWPYHQKSFLSNISCLCDVNNSLWESLKVDHSVPYPYQKLHRYLCCSPVQREFSCTLNNSGSFLSAFILCSANKTNCVLVIPCRVWLCFNFSRTREWHQELWQQQLMLKYGNIVSLMDATYKTTHYNLPLFFISTRTNIGYCAVEEFIARSESSEYINTEKMGLSIWLIILAADEWTNYTHWYRYIIIHDNSS